MKKTCQSIPIVLMFFILFTALSGASAFEWISSYSEKLIGIMVQDLTGDLAGYFKLSKDQTGILVTKVVAGSTADTAGIKVGDIITNLDGKTIDSVTTYSMLLEKNAKSNKKMKCDLFRDGKMKSVDLTVPTFIDMRDDDKKRASMFLRIPPDEDGQIFQFEPGEWAAPHNFLGVVVRELNDDMDQFLDYSGDHCVLVYEVVDGSPAEKAGLLAGDIIVDVNEKQVTDPEQLKELLNEFDLGADVSVGIVRKGKDMSVTAKLEERKGDAYMKFVQPLKNSWHQFNSDFHNQVMPELRDDLDNLRQEMKDLKKELNELKEKYQKDET